MAHEGAHRDVAGEQHRADDQPDDGHERERTKEQALMQRCGFRGHANPEGAAYNVGFRIVQEIDQELP